MKSYQVQIVLGKWNLKSCAGCVKASKELRCKQIYFLWGDQLKVAWCSPDKVLSGGSGLFWFTFIKKQQFPSQGFSVFATQTITKSLLLPPGYCLEHSDLNPSGHEVSILLWPPMPQGCLLHRNSGSHLLLGEFQLSPSWRSEQLKTAAFQRIGRIPTKCVTPDQDGMPLNLHHWASRRSFIINYTMTPHCPVYIYYSKRVESRNLILFYLSIFFMMFISVCSVLYWPMCPIHL